MPPTLNRPRCDMCKHGKHHKCRGTIQVTVQTEAGGREVQDQPCRCRACAEAPRRVKVNVHRCTRTHMTKVQLGPSWFEDIEKVCGHEHLGAKCTECGCPGWFGDKETRETRWVQVNA